MAQNSAAAALWWTFWGDYLDAVFRPWWKAAKVPVHKDRPGLAISPQNQFSLDQVLASWTTDDPANSAFSPPGGPHRTAPEVMRAAFATAVAHLAATLHGAPSSWAWGRIHSRQFPSVTQADALGYGPRASGADSWTVNAADGGLVSHQGPSWRMIVAWAGHGTATGEGVYPGGQSENPASPWYEDQMADWWDGRYLADAAGRRVPGRPGPLEPAAMSGHGTLARTCAPGPPRLPHEPITGAHEGSRAWLTCAGWASGAPTGWAGSAGRGRRRPRHRHRTTQASRRITGDRPACGCWPAWPGW